MKSLQATPRRRRCVNENVPVPGVTSGRLSATSRPGTTGWRRAGLTALPLLLAMPLLMATPVAAKAERVAALGVDAGLPAKLVAPESTLASAAADITAATIQAVPGPPMPKRDGNGLKQWLSDRLAMLEGVLEQSGLNVEALIERAGPEEMSTGEGGPLVPAMGEGPLPGAGATLGEDLDRLERVHRLLASVPLAAPMTEYRLTSGFGYRRDPFTGRAAVHEGQDFGGPRNAPVLATAPGIVVEAGRAGAYGNMVEIDHGMGIHTRYGHLRRVLVKVGQPISVSQQLGIMGSTGRSTGAHLHYEIRVDGRALDPMNFLAAGGQLLQLVGN